MSHVYKLSEIYFCLLSCLRHMIVLKKSSISYVTKWNSVWYKVWFVISLFIIKNIIIISSKLFADHFAFIVKGIGILFLSGAEKQIRDQLAKKSAIFFKYFFVRKKLYSYFSIHYKNITCSIKSDGYFRQIKNKYQLLDSEKKSLK